MATTLSSFKRETQLTATAETMVSTNTSETKFLGNLTVSNTSLTTNVEVVLWILNSTTTATSGSGGNQFLTRTIAANTTRKITEVIGHNLGPSMKLAASADTASVVNINISGTTET